MQKSSFMCFSLHFKLVEKQTKDAFHASVHGYRLCPFLGVAGFIEYFWPFER